eukprot:TRINITY_DN74204_c0_g1_i1.p1 TRINITY_DN74204_c0_g1~~TRINITY_DN74204_c0_g1_i1.p1  ORF type:complete len:216 (+),score=52.70 TRINITY_DN74204_c0_g1_i1:85-732(+)
MVLRRFATFYQKHAMMAGAALTGAKTAAADVLVQTQWEKKQEINWRRTAVFASFGFFYLGMFQHMQYAVWYTRWFPGDCWRAAAKKVAFDQIVNTACVYYPLFYMVQSCVMADEFTLARVQEGWERFKMNATEDLYNIWRLWVPAQAINFTLVPPHMRVLFGAAVSCVWSCILSIMRGDPTDLEDKAKAFTSAAIDQASEALASPSGSVVCSSPE